MDKRRHELALLRKIALALGYGDLLAVAAILLIVHTVAVLFFAYEIRSGIRKDELKRSAEVLSMMSAVAGRDLGGGDVQGVIQRAGLERVISWSMADRDGKVVMPAKRYGAMLDVRGVCTPDVLEAGKCQADANGVYRLLDPIKNGKAGRPSGFVLLEMQSSELKGPPAAVYLLMIAPSALLCALGVGKRRRRSRIMMITDRPEGGSVAEAYVQAGLYSLWLDVAEVVGWGLMIFDHRYRLVDLSGRAEKWLAGRIVRKGQSVVEVLKALPMGAALSGLINDTGAQKKALGVCRWQGDVGRSFELAVFECKAPGGKKFYGVMFHEISE